MDNYEKKYKEALQKARAINSGKYVDIPAEDTVLEYIFPELKSEDERIRKGLIENFKWFCGDFPETTKWGKNDDLFVKDIIAWLEKQESVGEIVARCKDSWYNEGKIQGQIEGLTDEEKYQQGWHDALEKQGEPTEINPTEFDTRLQALIGKFNSLPKEELIGSLSFWLNVVQNDGTYKEEKQGEKLQDWLKSLKERIKL